MLDNNLSPKLKDALNSLSFEVTHVKDYNKERASDEEIFNLAEKENRILISADTDFGFILLKRNQNKPSVILFRNFSTKFENQAKAIKLVVEKFKEELISGSLIVIEPYRVRLRKLPLLKNQS